MTCGWGDCANFFLTHTAKAALPTSGRRHSHLSTVSTVT